MFSNEKGPDGTKIDTLIGTQTELTGDLRFSGGLHVDGTIKGNVIAEDDSGSVLTVSEHGRIEGEVRVPFLVVDGTVNGDVHVSERVELAAKARVKGNVHYTLIEMAIGAQLNGKLVHQEDKARRPRAAGKKLEAVSAPGDADKPKGSAAEGSEDKAKSA